jgi:type IV secretion system protein VirB2
MYSGLRYRYIKIKEWTVKMLSGSRAVRAPHLAALVLMFPVPAWAQLSQVSTLLNTIQTTLLGVGGVICSISIIWAGFRMMFQHARFGDIANVFVGGLFVGCATVIASMLIPTS